MTQNTRLCRRAAAALLALGLGIGLVPGWAVAQAVPYCDGKVVADSFYESVVFGGGKVRVDYFVRLRNATPATILTAVHFTFNEPSVVFSDRLSNSYHIPRHGQVTLKLGVQTLPAGSSTADRVPRAKIISATDVVCASF